ncbi:MAG: diphosphomevalonate decarboxylase [Gammaproteobacteria bacterium]
MEATAQAQPNIALVKYWGKRDTAANLPAVGSLSITLDSLWTRTRVHFDAALDRDSLLMNGAPDTAGLSRVVECLDGLRRRAGRDERARVETENNFPTGAGLASSASGFAALVTAAGQALGLDLSAAERSGLARRASGSAARSIFGGFVEIKPPIDDEEAVAAPLLDADEWPLEVLVAITSRAGKSVGSTEGMERTRTTSDFYDAWVGSSDDDLVEARDAVLERDFERLASVSELSCLKMHGVAMSARPGLVYWNGATVECLHRIRELRQDGVGVFFTIDAGPQVKAVCLPGTGERVAKVLADVPGVLEVLSSSLGNGARIVTENES